MDFLPVLDVKIKRVLIIFQDRPIMFSHINQNVLARAFN